ncbi:MAG: hypothetical protein R3C18_09060 [Planctomycetaceae bacterium]
MFKQTLLTAAIAVTITACAQAQLISTSSTSLTSPTLTYSTSPDMTYSTPADPYMNLDPETGVLQIDGTIGNDSCIVYTTYQGLYVDLVIAAGKDSRRMWFDPDEVTRIVFNGGDGDDMFTFSNLNAMSYYRKTYGWFDIDCDLNGGRGTDMLCGGVGNDVLIGELDGCKDILSGGPGADLFVECTEQIQSSWYTYKRVEYEILEDVYEEEGDQVIRDYELEELLEQMTTSSESTSTMTFTYPILYLSY